MKISSLVILLACVFSCGHDVSGQDLVQSTMLNQRSIQSVKDSNPLPAMINGRDSQQGHQAGSTVEYGVADAPRPLPGCGCTEQPFLPVDSDNLVPGTQVTITSPAPDAVIYYTTDGWTPTETSSRYMGPITIKADTRLLAIAVEPNKLPSTIAEKTYTVSGSPAPKPESALAVGGILIKGTPLRLVTARDVTSETAQVGDRISILLDENVMVGERIAAPKGSPIEATITRVDRAGPSGKPGVIAFQVKSLNANGIHVPLSANLTLAASDDTVQAQRRSSTSQVHVDGAWPPGEEVEITPGLDLTASVAADTPLHR
jgi:Chitobiase/beta-hexosaminidase C-terminal domain